MGAHGALIKKKQGVVKVKRVICLVFIFCFLATVAFAGSATYQVNRPCACGKG